MGHEFRNAPGVILSTGDLVAPPKIEDPHHMFFVHGNHESSRLISDMRSDARNRNMTTREALHRICQRCNLKMDQVSMPASVVPSGAGGFNIEPGPRRISISDITPTQELVFTDTVGDYINGDPRGAGKPRLMLIEGKIYVAVGHHRIMAEILKGNTEVDVIVETQSEEEKKLGLVPVPHTRHPNLSSWGQIMWRRGTKEGRLERSQYGNYHPIFSGETIMLGGLRIAGIPGVFSEHLHEQSANAPLKYFTAEDVLAMMSLPKNIDILMMHDAPSGIGLTDGDREMGSPILRSIVEYLKPRLVLFGHHHRFHFGRIGETRVIGLDYPHRSYLTIDFNPKSESMRIMKTDSVMSDMKIGYQYAWQGGIQAEPKQVFHRRIPMGREQEIFEQIKSMKDDLHARVMSFVAPRVPNTVPDLADAIDMRAGLAVNTAIKAAARYATRIETISQRDVKSRKALADSIYEEMCGSIKSPQACEEILFSFQECLKALGLVWEGTKPLVH